MSSTEKTSKIISFLWDIAELLWGAVPKSENQNIILPLTVLRRLDYVLEPTKEAVLETEAKYKDKLENRHDLLCRTAGYAFYNKSAFSYSNLLDTDGAHLAANLRAYIAGFSENVQEIFQSALSQPTRRRRCFGLTRSKRPDQSDAARALRDLACMVKPGAIRRNDLRCEGP